MDQKRGESDLVEIRKSGIHRRGLFAVQDIAKGTRVIEYVGDKVTKAESDRRADRQLGRAGRNGDGAVYIFTLNQRYDIDGNVPWNPARLANHSCEPNCEAEIIRGQIWLIALRRIEKGEEITYNYNFDLEHFEEHSCRCGSRKCVGYIVGDEYWPKLHRELKKRREATGGRQVAGKNGS